MNSPSAHPIVNWTGHNKREEHQWNPNRPQSTDGCRQEVEGRKQHEAFMRFPALSINKGRGDKKEKGEEAGKENCDSALRIAACSRRDKSVPCAGNNRDKSTDHQDDRHRRAEPTEPAMKTRTPHRD